MQRDKNEEPDAYLQRCLQESHSRARGLFFRKSGARQTIGLPASGEEGVLLGTPHGWFQEEIVTFLPSQTWTNSVQAEIQSRLAFQCHRSQQREGGLQHPATMSWKTAGRTFCPSSLRQFRQSQQLTSSHFATHGKAQPFARSSSNPKNNLKSNPGRHGRAPGKEESSQRERSRSPAKSIQLGPPSPKPGSQEQSAPSQAASVGRAFDRLPSNPDKAKQQGWKQVDVKGTGDCMYCALAAARAYMKITPSRRVQK